MKLCRYNDSRVGVIVDGGIADVTPVLERLPPLRWPVPQGDVLIAALPRLRSELAAAARDSEPIPLEQARLLSPVANPGKIVGAPVNYAKHLDEATGDSAIHHGVEILPIQRIGLFLKAPSSLIGPGEPLCLRFPDRRSDHEVELAVVIGRTTNAVPRAQALECVAGYTVGLDMTCRGPEERSLRKSIDTYTVLGPWLVTADELGDPGGLDLTLSVNGEPRQASNTRLLLLDVPRLIEYASSFYTLHPGDVIMTGTPEGVGPVVPGDVIEACVERVGRMRIEARAA